jgi:hypothetical protein
MDATRPLPVASVPGVLSAWNAALPPELDISGPNSTDTFVGFRGSSRLAGMERVHGARLPVAFEVAASQVMCAASRVRNTAVERGVVPGPGPDLA